MTVAISFIIAGALIVCDQLIKLWAVRTLAPIGSIPVIDGLLRLTYVENYGAAFGILRYQRVLLILLPGAILITACCLLALGKLKSPVERLCAALIIAGGAGNLFDRLIRGFVVDYIDINELFSFPMFNLADSCVVCGALLMAAVVLFGEFRGGKAKGD